VFPYWLLRLNWESNPDCWNNITFLIKGINEIKWINEWPPICCRLHYTYDLHMRIIRCLHWVFNKFWFSILLLTEFSRTPIWQPAGLYLVESPCVQKMKKGCISDQVWSPTFLLHFRDFQDKSSWFLLCLLALLFSLYNLSFLMGIEENKCLKHNNHLV